MIDIYSIQVKYKNKVYYPLQIDLVNGKVCVEDDYSAQFYLSFKEVEFVSDKEGAGCE